MSPLPSPYPAQTTHLWPRCEACSLPLNPKAQSLQAHAVAQPVSLGSLGGLGCSCPGGGPLACNSALPVACQGGVLAAVAALVHSVGQVEG